MTQAKVAGEKKKIYGKGSKSKKVEATTAKTILHRVTSARLILGIVGSAAERQVLVRLDLPAYLQIWGGLLF